MLEWGKFVCGLMVVILPASIVAQESARAMLHDDGGVWLNEAPAPNTSAIFLNDLLQTQKGSLAKIDASGSAVTVQSDTIVQFEGDELVLDHGGLQVNTSRAMKVRVNCITVTPLTEEWTRYDVTDVNGRVMVAAYANDVKIHFQGVAARQSKLAAFSDVTVHQGEQVTREERCSAPTGPADGATTTAPILNSTWARGAGIATIGIITCWALCRGAVPVSPTK